MANPSRSIPDSDVHQIPCENPATGEVLGHAPVHDAEDARRAIAAAREAQRSWSTTPLKQRVRQLLRSRDYIVAEADANAAGLANVLMLHRDVRFDLFHANWPYSGEILFLAKALVGRKINGHLDCIMTRLTMALMPCPFSIGRFSLSFMRDGSYMHRIFI